MLVQQVHQGFVHLQRRLAAGEHGHEGPLLGGRATGHLKHGAEDVVGAHLGKAVERCVAEGAAQVAACEAHEDGCPSRVVTLALQREEYAVHPIHLFALLSVG